MQTITFGIQLQQNTKMYVNLKVPEGKFSQTPFIWPTFYNNFIHSLATLF